MNRDKELVGPGEAAIYKIPIKVWVHPDDLGRRDGLDGLSLAQYIVDYLNDACHWGFKLDIGCENLDQSADDVE